MLEAGFSDPDGDGILCTSPVIVNNLGQVIGCSVGVCNADDPENYNIVGDASYWTDDADNKVYRLTQNTGNQSGQIWSNDKVNLTSDFKVEGKIFFGTNNNGADGIAFIMQPISNSEGAPGGGLGYMGISPSIGVEFDTWYNIEYGDPTANDHAAIVVNGDGNTHLENVTLTNIEDGQYHDFIFNWVASTKTMTVSLDGN